MTLDIQKWIKQLITKQQDISHYDWLEFRIYKTSKMPENVKSDIQKQFGDSYLLDAQYVLFFKNSEGEFDDKLIKKVFKLVNESLGKGANNSTENDFKKYVPGGEQVNEDIDAEDSEPEDAEEPEEEQLEPSAGYIFAKITIK